MTAYTSSQAGNWTDSATWGGSGVPTDGDTATINHSVVLDTDVTIGTSPSDQTTYAVTLATNGLLTINSGGILRAKGSIRVNRTTAGIALQINGTGTIEFNSLAAASTTKYRIFCTSTGRVGMAGTDDANRATIKSVAGGQNWVFATIYASLPSIDYAEWINCDTFPNEFPATSVAGQYTSITNTKFTNCGIIKLTTMNATSTVIFSGNKCTGQTGAQGMWARCFAGSTYVLDGNVLEKNLLVNAGSQYIVATNNYFGGGFYNLTGQTGWAAGSGNNFYKHGTGGTLPWYGGFDDTYYFHNIGDGGNFFAVNFACNAAGQSISRNILDYADTNLHDPDGFGINQLPAGTDYTIENNIFLPDSAGVSSGTWLNNYQTTTDGSMSINHNTYITADGYETGIYVGESGRGRPGQISSFKSNLAWCPAGITGGYKIKRAGTIQDHVYAADADYNWGWNLQAGTDGNGYNGSVVNNFFSTGTPDVNGGNGDPGFVDTTRNLVRFDIDYLGNSPATAWADATAYAVGDVVSASAASYYDGETINWRCITAHTSAAGDTTNGKPGDVSGFRTNWEPMSLYRIREDVSRIETLLDWVRDGFAVTNPSLDSAGHDGETIGASYFSSSDIILDINNVEVRTELSQLAVAVDHMLDINSIQSVSQLSQPDVSVDGVVEEIVLSINNVEVRTQLNQLAVTANFALSINSIESNTQLSRANVTVSSPGGQQPLFPHTFFLGG